MLESQTGPPLGIENVKVFGISPLSVAILRTFSKKGGQSRHFLGGASLETFSGEAQFKKPPCNFILKPLAPEKGNALQMGFTKH